MAQLAIKGHSTRGKEVIETLEMLGGKSNGNMRGYNDDLYYFIATDGLICGSGIEWKDLGSKFPIFTLEEFLDKYPYKVGDKVLCCGIETIIKNIDWDSSVGEIIYFMDILGVTKGVYMKDLQPYKEQETMGKKNDTTEITIEYYFEEGSNDKVLRIPNNQEIVIENGIYILRDKKPQYPKDYEACCDILGINAGEASFNTHYANVDRLFESLYKLYICRNAYWKIIGKEMGLDKPWEPDWDNLSINHEFIKINKGCFIYSSRVLVFPTQEMRDEFYENFKDLIEQCKELL